MGTDRVCSGRREPKTQLALAGLLAASVCLAPRPGLAANADSGERLEVLTKAAFDNPTRIDNQWLPLTPGTRWVYEGTAVEDDGKRVPRRLEITVTDLVKTIGGVRTVVSYDLDYSDNELVEAELAFYAQDNDGNVWSLGEYPEEYEDGKFVKAPSWLHGLEGAVAGIAMKAEPRPGSPSYSQGWGPAVDWADRGEVFQTGQRITVPAGTYDNVLVIRETSRTEAGAYQLKYYAPRVGNVRTGWGGAGEKTKEVLDLVRIDHLGPEALADIRARALRLEKSAYEKSRDVYARTAPSAAR